MLIEQDGVCYFFIETIVFDPNKHDISKCYRDRNGNLRYGQWDMKNGKPVLLKCFLILEDELPTKIKTKQQNY